MATPLPMKQIERLHQRLRHFNATPEGRSQTLRADLATIMIQRLSELGWTQKELARRCGKPESFISRLIHTDTNCTFEVAAHVLHTLGVQPRLVNADTLPAAHPQAPDAARTRDSA
ncbi:MAG: helix-turn-helix domain-containing protein [Phycisphaerales bacterium]|nr:helix-turn-helix domain-containing protein [Phycisphaerales bacterium]